MSVDTKKVIKDLGATNFSTSNEKQMKMVQLLKGIALSEEEISNDFMKKLDKAITTISKQVLNPQVKESVLSRAEDILF